MFALKTHPARPPQFGLKWLFLLPVAAGMLTWLYTAGLAAELLFVLLAVPLILVVWLGLCRAASYFLTDLFD